MDWYDFVIFVGVLPWLLLSLFLFILIMLYVYRWAWRKPHAFSNQEQDQGLIPISINQERNQDLKPNSWFDILN